VTKTTFMTSQNSSTWYMMGSYSQHINTSHRQWRV